jgi:hypothetical protein
MLLPVPAVVLGFMCGIDVVPDGQGAEAVSLITVHKLSPSLDAFDE